MIRFIFSFKLWLRRIIGLFYLSVLVIISLMPASDLPQFTIFSNIDKAIHICMYLGLSFLTCWSLEINSKRMAPLYILLAGIFMWGVLMEILQRTMHNGRNFDFRDMIANLTGAIIGLMIYRYFDRKRLEIEERQKLSEKG